MSEIDDLLHEVIKNRDEGKVLFHSLGGVVAANLAEFINQPAAGILYDLNREEITTTSSDITKKIINDLAVATVIRYLHAELARRNEIIARLKEDAERLAQSNSADTTICLCGYPDFRDTHAIDCPIASHNALMKELEE